MTLKYTNRFGDTYFLQVGRTRTGKPNYYCGRKITGTPLDEVPKGYEIRESPERGQVFVRKALCSAITPDERQMVEDRIRRFAGLKHFLVDVEKDSLVVYLPGMGESEADRVVELLAGPMGSFSRRAQEGREWLISRSQYTKMLRFVLIDAERHLFTVERWCFLGSIDGWISVGGPGPLPLLVDKFAQHLGKESFYDLL
jgi:hypothetical protein